MSFWAWLLSLSASAFELHRNWRTHPAPNLHRVLSEPLISGCSHLAAVETEAHQGREGTFLWFDESLTCCWQETCQWRFRGREAPSYLRLDLCEGGHAPPNPETDGTFQRLASGGRGLEQDSRLPPFRGAGPRPSQSQSTALAPRPCHLLPPPPSSAPRTHPRHRVSGQPCPELISTLPSHQSSGALGDGQDSGD